MRRKSLIAAVCAVAAVVLAAAPAIASPASKSAATSKDGADIVELPITFHVANTNRTPVACPSDGKNYTVRGTVIGPRDAVESGDAATLYLHAVTWGQYYWNFKGVPDYAYAHQLAEKGHVSVAVDRLGYGDSDRPPGLDTCFGSEADVASQMVEALRKGTYQLDGATPAEYKKVFIGGSSVGGLTSHIEAYTFHNVDGVFNMAWGDFAASAFTAEELIDVLKRCGNGGDAGADPNYAAFAKNSRETFYFNSATQDVRDAVPALHPDPCGQIRSIPAGIASDVLHNGEINVPVLVMFGDADAVFPPPAADQEALRYLGSPKVTKVIIPGASHYPNVEANHLQVVSAVDAWLTSNGG